MNSMCYKHELDAYKLDITDEFYGSIKQMIETKLLANILWQDNLFI